MRVRVQGEGYSFAVRAAGQIVSWSGWLNPQWFVEGLGRTLMSKGEAEPAAGESRPRVVVHGAVLFNARASASVALNPFFSARNDNTLDALLEFEDISDLEWKGLFHDGELKLLNLAAAHKTRSIYDALLRPSETMNQDGSRRRVVHEPLMERALDENDVDSTSLHFNTPIACHRDGLARQIRTDESVRLNDDGTPSSQINTWGMPEASGSLIATME